MATALPYTNSSLSNIAWNKQVYRMIQSGKPSGYDQTLREKNPQLTELKFYINNIARCIGIVYILSARRQYHLFNTFTSVILSYKSIIYKAQTFDICQ